MSPFLKRIHIEVEGVQLIDFAEETSNKKISMKCEEGFMAGCYYGSAGFHFWCYRYYVVVQC